MSNVEIVKDAYAKFGNGDIPGLLNLLAADIEWRTPTVEGASFTGLRNGRESVAEFFTLLDAAEEFTLFEPREFIAQGDKVVVVGTSSARVKSTGRTATTDWVHLFTVRDQKITNFVEFFDSAAVTRAYQRTATA